MPRRNKTGEEAPKEEQVLDVAGTDAAVVEEDEVEEAEKLAEGSGMAPVAETDEEAEELQAKAHEVNTGFAVAPEDVNTPAEKEANDAKASVPAPAEGASLETQQAEIDAHRAEEEGDLDFEGSDQGKELHARLNIPRNPLASPDDPPHYIALTPAEFLAEQRVQAESDSTEEDVTAKKREQASRNRTPSTELAQQQTDAINQSGEDPENRDLEQERAHAEAQPDDFADPSDLERVRAQVTNKTDNVEDLERERTRFRPRNDPQREAGIDSADPTQPEIVLNQDKTR